jgi:2-keto-4-pentenoate hydratase/2-oxohepta-3-ene-1,7-dioic acid hydratase in catechol pathway
MRLVTFTHHGNTRAGVMVLQSGEEYVLDISAQAGLPGDVIEFLNAGESAFARVKQAASSPDERCLLSAADVTLLAPVPRPGKIICLGHNYYDHMGKGKTEPAEYPTFFCKTVNTIIGPGQAIVIPRVTQQVDYEAELAVVIGKRARRVTQERALEFIAGYTIFNDVSARDYQKRTSQWMIGKCFDTFGPMGPALVTTDEIPDPHCLELSLTVNDHEMQRTNTRNMIFTIPYLIAYLSDVMTLEPGDVISTGTPAKTSLAQSVPPFIKPGDRVKICIEKIGELVSPVVAEA